jgi:hypothetical protein
MSFEFAFTLTVLLGFTAYYFWYHGRGFPRVPPITWCCGSVFFCLTVWLVAAYTAVPEVDSVNVYEVHRERRADGAIQDVVVTEDAKLNINKAISGSLPDNSKVRVIKFKDYVYGLRLHRSPVIEIID